MYSFATCLFWLALHVGSIHADVCRPSSLKFTAVKVNLSGLRLLVQWISAGEMHTQIRVHCISENESKIPKHKQQLAESDPQVFK